MCNFSKIFGCFPLKSPVTGLLFEMYSQANDKENTKLRITDPLWGEPPLSFIKGRYCIWKAYPYRGVIMFLFQRCHNAQCQLLHDLSGALRGLLIPRLNFPVLDQHSVRTRGTHRHLGQLHPRHATFWKHLPSCHIDFRRWHVGIDRWICHISGGMSAFSSCGRKPISVQTQRHHSLFTELQDSFVGRKGHYGKKFWSRLHDMSDFSLADHRHPWPEHVPKHLQWDRHDAGRFLLSENVMIVSE